MKLTTVKDVELAATGRYALESGETEFTEEHLADAVRAATDPTVVAPRIGLGHDFEKVFGDAAPAFGHVENMRLANNGTKIIGDLVDVPEQFAAGLAAHYPGRSIEGGFDYKAPSGNTYKLAISKLALLGTAWPGITNLKDITVDDLNTILSANGKIGTPVKVADDAYELPVAGTAARVVTAKMSEPANPVSAKLNVADFRRVFQGDLRAGTVKIGDADVSKVWARSVEAGEEGALTLVVDDSAGRLYELPVTVEGEGLKYGEPRERAAVAASSGTPVRVLASWAEGTSPSTTEASMDRKTITTRLGLPEDADDAAIGAAVAAKPTALSEAASTETATAPVAEPAAAAASAGTIPEGFVLVDKGTLDEIRAGASAGAAVAASIGEQERDLYLNAAITDGRFAAGSRQTFEELWAVDKDRAKAVIAAMPKGTIPVDQRSRATGGDETVESEDAIVAGIEAKLFPELRSYEGSVLAGAVRAAAANNAGGR